MPVHSRAVGRLAAAMTGAVVLPDDAGYDDARVSFNGTVDRRPTLIARCTTVGDVQAAMRCAGELDLPVSIRGGGHSVAGHGIGEGAVMIDLSRMRSVAVEAERRVAHVAGGCIWDDVDAAAFAHRLAVPGGTYGDTGVGGLTLGGGLGWLLGTQGLTCDNLLGATLVTPSGDTVTAGAEGDPELLWALRGGGGNFGAVTTFELGLAPRGPMTGGYLDFAVSDLGVVLAALQQIVADAPDELVVMPWIGTPADGRQGEPVVGVGVAFAGDSAALEPVLAPLRAAAAVLSDSIGPKSYLEIQAMNGRLPFGLRHYWKGHFVGALTDELVGAIVAGLDRRPAGRSGVLLEALTGVAARTPPERAAFGQRGAAWNVSALAIWDDAADDDELISWTREIADSLLPFSVTGGGYVNYVPPDETPERVLAAYGDETFRRLAAVKRRYDPENRLRFNLNVPPA